MKFQEYNPNINKDGCVVRTFMKLLDKSYAEVKEDLTDLAASMGYDSYTEVEVFEEYFKRNDFIKIDDDYFGVVNDLSLDNGSYGIFCFNDFDYHMFPVVDRIAYDKSDRFWKMNVISLYKLNK